MRTLILACMLFFSSINGGLEAQSLSEVPFKWKSDKDKEFSFQELIGKPAILTMVYTGCKSACPLTTTRMKDIEKGLGENAKNFNFVMVSLDPANDTPKTLAAMKKKYHMKDENWILLVGNEQDTRKLGILIDLAYERIPDSKDIVHGNRIVLLDKDLKINFSVEGLGSELEPLIEKSKMLIQ